jgi:DNA-binding PadR family transcriptional regulator
MRQAKLPEDHQRLLPLSPAIFYILLSLCSGAKHGYAIMLETASLSDHSFRMGPATLYATIQKLTTLELLQEIVALAGEDPRRRYYELTSTGRRLLESDLARMRSAVRLAQVRLASSPTED